MAYYRFSDYLKNKYGERVYKLPIKLEGTCPNRDGSLSYGGCAFCGEEGGSFENLDGGLTVKDQLKINRDFISKRYKARKFIAYFQNYTNTYMDLELFKSLIIEAIEDDIVAIYISTRPDCLSKDQLSFLRQIQEEYGIDIVIELGLQTVNYKILKEMNRGHGLAEFIDAVTRTHDYGLEVCCHLIIGLPGEEMIDIVEASKVLSSLKVDQVKLHALYILKGTAYGDQYLSGNLDTISLEEYKRRVVEFLRYLDPSIVIQRIIGRSEEGTSLFANWDTSWWKIHDDIIAEMQEQGYKQGDLFDYLQPVEKVRS